MSASREKKKRQEILAGGTTDPKAARAAQEAAAVRKSNRLYGGIFIVLAVLAVALLVYNSGIIQRGKTAVTIDGEKYTVPQVSYYYQQAYQNFMNTYGGYASLFGLDTSKSLKDQAYSEDQSWDEYFKEQAVTNMRLVHAAKAAAKADGVVLDGEELEAYNESLDAFKAAAAQQGYSYKSYLTAIYGPTMTPSIYEACSQDSFLASKYSSEYAGENFVYSDDEIQAYYEENKNTYDLVDGGYVTISGTPETKTDDEGNTIEATDEEKEAAMNEARAAAQRILDLYNTSHDLGGAAAAEDGASYNVSEELSYSSTTYGDWLFDESRRAGDAEILEDGSVCYVAVFNERKRDDVLDYNVRHILVTAENLELAEGEEATEEQLTAKAQEILDSWDGTEDGFAKLANENSKDPGSNTTGGLYEDVPKGRMVSEFQNWCYEPGRKSGDTGVIYSASTGGAHIMYFVGYGDTQYWHYACENAMVNSAMNEWQQSLIDSVTAETDAGGMNSVG